MTAVAEREAIVGVLAAEWADRMPLGLPNADFTPPTEGFWARLSIVQGDAVPVEFGGIVNTERVDGVAFVSLFGPLRRGDAELREHADAVAAMFKRKVVAAGDNGCMRFRKARIRDAGRTDTHYQFNVAIPYQLDTVS